MSARAEMKTEAFMIARKLAMLRWFALELRWHTHQFQLVRSLCMARGKPAGQKERPHADFAIGGQS